MSSSSSSSSSTPSAPSALVHRKVWLRDLCDPRTVVRPPRSSSFVFGSPAAELLCVRVMGVVVGARDGVVDDAGGDGRALSVFEVDDSSAVMRVVVPAEIVAVRGGARPRVGDLVDFVGRLEEHAGGRRRVMAAGFDAKADCMWEPLRYAEMASLYAAHYFRGSGGVVCAPEMPPAASAARAAALDAAAAGKRPRSAAFAESGAPSFAVESPGRKRSRAAAGPAPTQAAVAAAVAAGGTSLESLCGGAFAGHAPAAVKAAVDALILDGCLYEKNGVLLPL